MYQMVARMHRRWWFWATLPPAKLTGRGYTVTLPVYPEAGRQFDSTSSPKTIPGAVCRARGGIALRIFLGDSVGRAKCRPNREVESIFSSNLDRAVSTMGFIRSMNQR